MTVSNSGYAVARLAATRTDPTDEQLIAWIWNYGGRRFQDIARAFGCGKVYGGGYPDEEAERAAGRLQRQLQRLRKQGEQQTSGRVLRVVGQNWYVKDIRP